MAFTSITGSTQWLTAAIYNELIAAINERATAVGLSTLSTVSAGEIAQAATLWNTLQQWVETNCVNFVDHTAIIAGQSSVPMFTWASLKTASGLTSGWRKATAFDPDTDDWTDYADAMYTYGQAAASASHILGPWLAVDLQTAIHTLTWTTRHNGSSVDGETRYPSPAYIEHVNCADAVSQWAVVWALSSWSSDSALIYYADAYFPNIPPWRCGAKRDRAKCQITGVPTHVPCSCSLYMLPGSVVYDFRDIDSLGMSDSQLWEWEPLTSSSASTRTSSLFDPSSANPCTQAGISCPNEESLAVVVGPGDVYWILKWSFAY